MRGLVAVAVAGLVVAGCGGDGGGEGDDPAPTGSPSPSVSATGYEVRRIDRPQMSLGVSVGAGERLTTSPDTAGDGCPATWSALESDGESAVVLTVYGPDCRHDGTAKPGNGRHGAYRSAEDVPADRRAGAERVRTPLGEALVFTQPYFECTQSCEEWEEPVAVIDLTRPADPGFPTLVVRSDKGVIGQDELTEFVRHRLEP
ncbi:hypothetical protein [Streptomyces capparidis]